MSAVRRLAQPVPQPGQKGTTGFTKNRPYTVSFAETATTPVAPLKQGCQVPTPQGRANLKRIRDGLHQCELAGRPAKRLGTSLQVHESHVLRSRGVFVWCQQCGAYYSSAEPRIRLLKRKCQVASQRGRANLQRIREGLPPGNADAWDNRLGRLSLPPLHKRQGSMDPAAIEDHTLRLQDPSPTTLSIACHGGHAMSMAGRDGVPLAPPARAPAFLGMRPNTIPSLSHHARVRWVGHQGCPRNHKVPTCALVTLVATASALNVCVRRYAPRP